MSNRGDWMPSDRNGQLTMAKTWCAILGAKGETWGVPADVVTRISQKANVAGSENDIPASERNTVSSARLKTAFGELSAEMRDAKKRYFYNPPLSDADLLSLGLKPKDNEPTPVNDPTGQAEAGISFPGRTQLMLHIKHVAGQQNDARAYYGCRIYWGIPDAGDPPPQGYHLRESKFTRKKKELFTFQPAESGKTVYFCIRYENSKGVAGPWGPVTSAIIP